MTREFLTGSGDWGYDCYFQAVTEGMIDPKEVDLNSFLSKADHKRIDLTSEINGWTETNEYYKEYLNSKLNVSNLVKGGRDREEIIRKWFGEDFLKD